jgi:hypothetical protein
MLGSSPGSCAVSVCLLFPLLSLSGENFALPYSRWSTDNTQRSLDCSVELIFL